MTKALTVDYEIAGYTLYSGKRSREMASSLTYHELLMQVTAIFLSEQGQNMKYKLRVTPNAKVNMPESRRDLLENIVELQNKKHKEAQK